MAESHTTLRCAVTHISCGTAICVAVTVLLFAKRPAAAQTQPTTNTVAGVVIDAEGMLRMRTYRDPNPLVSRRRVAAALAKLDRELARRSPLRKVSLTRLEANLTDRLNKHQPVTVDMKFLAGLTKIRYVFFYPDTRDIVIAGPAEGFAPDPSGRMIGVFSKRPVLELQDLIVALRAFPPAGTKTGVISVSIDPTMEGLERLRRQVANIGHFARPGDARAIATTLRRSLGKQIVSVKGVSPNTHFAQVLVEADYRMKLIGIGLERPPVRIESYVDKANPATAAQNALKRWYFVPEYECVRVSEDGLAMELVGEVVKLVGEDQLVTPGGRRVVSRQVGRASRGFTLSFTRHYPSLAKQVPVYGQLKNLIDMAIAAAYVQHQDYYEMAEWNLGTFADEKRYSVEVFVPPQQVESAINVVWKGNTLMTPIGGGVNIQPSSALTDDRLIPDEENEVKSAHGKNRLEGLPKHVWWWD